MSKAKQRVTYMLREIRIPPHKLARGQPIPPALIHVDRKKHFKAGYLKHTPSKAEKQGS